MGTPTEFKDKQLIDALKEARKFFDDTAKANLTFISAIAASLLFKKGDGKFLSTVPVFLFAAFFGVASGIVTSYIGGKYRRAWLCQSQLTDETKSYVESLGLDDCYLRQVARSARTSVYGVFGASSIAVTMRIMPPLEKLVCSNERMRNLYPCADSWEDLEWLLAVIIIVIIWTFCFLLFNGLAPVAHITNPE